MRRILTMIACLGLLAACFDDSATRRGDTLTSRLPAPAEDSCDANRLGYLIGRPYQIAQSAPSLPANSRIYGQDDMITMDFNPNRLNVIHGADGIVQRLSCG